MFLLINNGLDKDKKIAVEYLLNSKFGTVSGRFNCQDFVTDILNIDFSTFLLIREYYNFHKELGHISNYLDQVNIEEILGDDSKVNPYFSWKDTLEKYCFNNRKNRELHYSTVNLIENLGFSDEQLFNLYKKLLISFKKNFYYKNENETSKDFCNKLKHSLQDFCQITYLYLPKYHSKEIEQVLFSNYSIDNFKQKRFSSTAEMIIDDILISFCNIDNLLGDFVFNKVKNLLDELRNFPYNINLSFSNSPNDIEIIDKSLTFDGFLQKYFGSFKEYLSNDIYHYISEFYHKIIDDKTIKKIYYLYQMLTNKKFIEHFKNEVKTKNNNSNLLKIPQNYYYDYEIKDPIHCEQYLTNLYNNYETRVYKTLTDEFLLGDLFCICLISIKLSECDYTTKKCLVCGHYFHTENKKAELCPKCNRNYGDIYSESKYNRKKLNDSTSSNNKITKEIKEYRKNLIVKLEKKIRTIYETGIKYNLYWKYKQLNSFSYNFTPQFVLETELELMNINENILYLDCSYYNVGKALDSVRKNYLKASKMEKIFMDKFSYKREEEFEDFQSDMKRLFDIDIENIEGYDDIKSSYK